MPLGRLAERHFLFLHKMLPVAGFHIARMEWSGTGVVAMANGWKKPNHGEIALSPKPLKLPRNRPFSFAKQIAHR